MRNWSNNDSAKKPEPDVAGPFPATPAAFLGIGVSRGIAIGQARLLQHGQFEILEYALPAQCIEEEVQRFRDALQTALQELHSIRGRIPASAPNEIAAFIDTHLLMLRDTALSAGPEELIRSRRCNAEWALKLQQDALVRVFDEMDDPYLRTRRDDIEHVVRRVQRILLNKADRPQTLTEADGRRVVLADDLSPSELVLLHSRNVCALITEHGGQASHTAILARSLGIPAVVGIRHPEQYIRDDELVVVDGHRGIVLVGLSSRDIAHYRRQQQAERRHRVELRSLKDAPAVTRDGHPIGLHANIELPEDITASRRVGASAVGLFRTEFLFMNRPAPPDEEEQFELYRKAVRRMDGAPVTIRTLDLGADKQPGFQLDAGPNPALGLRAIRLCLKEVDLFVAQVRAILRASAFGPVRLLIPMLTNLHELAQAMQIIDTVKRSMSDARLRYDPHLPIGAMIEVPAAALSADAFASRLDFLSIGTNDLIQYTLATDRMDKEVSHLYDPLHPAVLRLIRMTLKSAVRNKIPVSMCGEMAGDSRYTRLLLGMGLNEFSMPPSAILEIKRAVTQCDQGELKRKVAPILRCDHPAILAEMVERLNAD